MNCEKVRELLLTDHVDSELDADTAALVRSHLAKCASCKAFEATVLHAAVEPFKGAGLSALPTPPAYIWKRIERAIGNERPSRAPFAFPKPVFVMATVAMLVVAVALFAHTRYAEQRDLALYVEEEMMFLSSLGENGAMVDDEDLYSVTGGFEKYSRGGNSAAESVV